MHVRVFSWQELKNMYVSTLSMHTSLLMEFLFYKFSNYKHRLLNLLYIFCAIFLKIYLKIYWWGILPWTWLFDMLTKTYEYASNFGMHICHLIKLLLLLIILPTTSNVDMTIKGLRTYHWVMRKHVSDARKKV